jgi:hypothetical protein
MRPQNVKETINVLLPGRERIIGALIKCIHVDPTLRVHVYILNHLLLPIQNEILRVIDRG